MYLMMMRPYIQKPSKKHASVPDPGRTAYKTKWYFDAYIYNIKNQSLDEIQLSAVPCIAALLASWYRCLKSVSMQPSIPFLSVMPTSTR